MKDNYIKAIIEMIQSGAEIDSVLSGLSKTLEAKGHTRLHASVLRGVVRALGTSTASSESKVIVADESELKKYTDAVEDALRKLGGDTAYKTEVDRTIIGGFIAQSDNKIIDNSYKAHLVSLYRKVAK